MYMYDKYSQTIYQFEQDRSQELEDHEYIGEQRNCYSRHRDDLLCEE